MSYIKSSSAPKKCQWKHNEKIRINVWQLSHIKYIKVIKYETTVKLSTRSSD